MPKKKPEETPLLNWSRACRCDLHRIVVDLQDETCCESKCHLQRQLQEMVWEIRRIWQRHIDNKSETMTQNKKLEELLDKIHGK